MKLRSLYILLLTVLLTGLGKTGLAVASARVSFNTVQSQILFTSASFSSEEDGLIPLPVSLAGNASQIYGPPYPADKSSITANVKKRLPFINVPGSYQPSPIPDRGYSKTPGYIKVCLLRI
jgi:hypothetical protein